MTPEQIERLHKYASWPVTAVPFRDDLRALLAEWEEVKRERDAFVAVLDPDGKNVVSAMVEAQLAEERCREIERLQALLNEQKLLTSSYATDVAQRGREIERLKASLLDVPDSWAQERTELKAEIERLKDQFVWLHRRCPRHPPSGDGS